MYLALFGVCTTLVLLLVSKLLQRLMTPGHETTSELQGTNEARRLLQVGDVFATFLVAAYVVKNNVHGQSLSHDVVWVAAFGFAGVLLFKAVGALSVRALLSGRLGAEVERGNAAAGLAGAAHLLSAGILASRAAAGTDLRSLGLAMVFYVLAQVTHLLFVTLFRALTTYDDAEQIAGENLAAAISYAGLSVAVAVFVARGVEGDFTGWASSLKGYASVVAFGFLLYPVRQLVVQGVLLGARPTLRGGALDTAIGTERSEGMAALEAAAYLATALAVSRIA